MSVSDQAYSPELAQLRAILGEARTIAVVGLSANPERYSFEVAGYLQRHGYRIVPVNPNETEILGAPAYPSLLEVPEAIDVVDVFRRSGETPAIARQAVAIGAKVLWLQDDIVSEEAREIAEAGGLDVIMGLCIMATHRRLRAG